jgi:hypothetical protein
MVRLLVMMWACVVVQFTVTVELFLTSSPNTITMVSVNFASAMFTFILTLNVILHYQEN